MNSTAAGTLSVRNLGKTFDRGNGSVEVLREVSLDVAPGEFLTVIGSSGAGKTTLIRIIAGLTSASNGVISYGGRPLKPGEVSFVFQKPVLFPQLTVRQNILFGTRLKRYKGVLDRTHYRKILNILGLDGLENRLPKQLSGGQQQRVGIARALVRKAPIVLFDEPLASVDELHSASIRSALQQLHRELGFTALFITHHINEALQLGQRLAVMDSGTIIQCDVPQRVLAEPETLAVAELTGQPVVNKIFSPDDVVPRWVHTVRAAVLRSSSNGLENNLPVEVRLQRITDCGMLCVGTVLAASKLRDCEGVLFEVPAGQELFFFGEYGVGEQLIIGAEAADYRSFPWQAPQISD